MVNVIWEANQPTCVVVLFRVLTGLTLYVKIGPARRALRVSLCPLRLKTNAYMYVHVSRPAAQANGGTQIERTPEPLLPQAAPPTSSL
jgi:hypothetical protein